MTKKNLTPVEEELLNRADKIIDGIANTVNKGTEFVQEQLPDVALQYIMYGRVYETMTIVLATLTALFGIWLSVNVGFRNTLKLEKNSWNDWNDARIPAVISGFFSTVMGLMVAIVNLKSFILVWFAPKIWLVLEISKLIR